MKREWSAMISAARGRTKVAHGTWRSVGLLALAPLLTGAFHLAEIHLVDEAAGAWARAVTGWDFGGIGRWEAPVGRALQGALAPEAVAALTVYYLAGFVALLAFAPGIIAAAGNARRLRVTLLCYPLVYAVALPFYLFFPSVNPYTSLSSPSPFDAVHPQLEAMYYTFTTRDNTLPSLHVAFTVMLVWQVFRADRSLGGALVVTYGALLIPTVVVLRVHFVTDVLVGMAVAIAGLALARVAERHLTDRAAARAQRHADEREAQA